MEEYLNNVKIVGDFNQAPPNLQEILLEEFARSKFFVYSFSKVEYRQITDKEVLSKLGFKHYFAMKLFWFHDGTGVGMCSDYHNKSVRYFKFSICDHAYTTIVSSNCYREMECARCGHYTFIDSSG